MPPLWLTIAHSLYSLLFTFSVAFSFTGVEFFLKPVKRFKWTTIMSADSTTRSSLVDGCFFPHDSHSIGSSIVSSEQNDSSISRTVGCCFGISRDSEMKGAFVTDWWLHIVHSTVDCRVPWNGFLYCLWSVKNESKRYWYSSWLSHCRRSLNSELVTASVCTNAFSMCLEAPAAVCRPRGGRVCRYRSNARPNTSTAHFCYSG